MMAILGTGLLVLAVLRISELVYSRRNWHKHRNHATRPKESIYPWMVALHSSVFILLPLEWWWRRTAFSGWLSWTALTVLLIALGLRIWTLITLGSSWNVRVVQGPTYPITSHGPYRWIRHPNYLVVILELLTIPLTFHLYGSALVLSILNGIILGKRIPTEEAMLYQNPEWTAAMAHKPRFFPNLLTNRPHGK